jgi:hypothetical protein
MIRPGSCSSGLRSRPSSAPGSRRSKGFEVNRMNSRKPALTSPSTPSTRATMARATASSSSATASVHEHQHQHPQQQRALVAAPDGCDAVLQRQQRVRMLRDIDHREIVLDESRGQAAESDRQQQRLRDGRRARQRHPRLPVRYGRRSAAVFPAPGRRRARGRGRSYRVPGSWACRPNSSELLLAGSWPLLAAAALLAAARSCASPTALAASGGM